MNRFLRNASLTIAGAALAAGVASPAAAAHRTPPLRPVSIEGVIALPVDAPVEGDAADSITVEVVRASGRASRAWVRDAAEVTVELGSRTRFSSPRRLVRSADDLRTGEHVLVQALLSADGTATARRVTVRLLGFEGTVNSYVEPTLDMTVDEANRPGDTWLDTYGEGDPASVSLDTSGARFDDDVLPTAGAEVEVLARVSADDPTALEAIAVEVEEQDDDEEVVVPAPDTTVGP